MPQQIRDNIYLYQLTNEYMTISALNLGAAITEIRLKEAGNISPNMIASYYNTMDYIDHPYHYMNTMVGPIAGRIAYGGASPRLSINQGKHHLHGGFSGISEQLFNVEKRKERNRKILRFTLDTEHTSDGYAGRFTYQIDYILEEKTFTIVSECRPSAPQHLSLTSHLYFNLSGDLERSIQEHHLMLPAKKRVRIHADGHPDAILPIEEGDAYDFSTTKKIAANLTLHDPILSRMGGYDTPFILEEDRTILLQDPMSQRQLTITTNAPAIVVYTASHFNDRMILNKKKVAKPLDAIALETQNLPNAQQLDASFAPIYSADRPYHQETRYTFTSPNFVG